MSARTSNKCVGGKAKDGFIVEMVGGVEGASWHFCCAALVWEQILQLARENGWRPLGTGPDTAWKRLWDAYGKFAGDYKCDEWGKTVSAADAASLADALERASKQPLPACPKGPVLLREGMTGDQHRRANGILNAPFLAEFVAFLRKGEFTFFWDN